MPHFTPEELEAAKQEALRLHRVGHQLLTLANALDTHGHDPSDINSAAVADALNAPNWVEIGAIAKDNWMAINRGLTNQQSAKLLLDALEQAFKNM